MIKVPQKKRTHVVLPEDLVADIDRLVGKRGRSAFLAEIARDEIMRLGQRSALKAAAGAWKDEDHPELRSGSAVWIRTIRAESKARLQRIQQRRKSG